MIANISPAVSACEHTLNTLRYTERVKELKKQQSSQKQSYKDRELGLARQTQNSTQIQLNQQTLLPKEMPQPMFKPTLLNQSNTFATLSAQPLHTNNLATKKLFQSSSNDAGKSHKAPLPMTQPNILPQQQPKLPNSNSFASLQLQGYSTNPVPV